MYVYKEKKVTSSVLKNSFHLCKMCSLKVKIEAIWKENILCWRRFLPTSWSLTYKPLVSQEAKDYNLQSSFEGFYCKSMRVGSAASVSTHWGAFFMLLIGIFWWSSILYMLDYFHASDIYVGFDEVGHGFSGLYVLKLFRHAPFGNSCQ